MKIVFFCLDYFERRAARASFTLKHNLKGFLAWHRSLVGTLVCNIKVNKISRFLSPCALPLVKL